jgi:hypothetical protein
LQRLRLDLQARVAREGGQQKGAPSDFWSHLQRYESLRHRVERLGYSRDEANQVHALAARKKPTPELLGQLRAQARNKALVAPAPKQLPNTKTIIRAYVDLKKAGVQRVYLLSFLSFTSSPASPWARGGASTSGSTARHAGSSGCIAPPRGRSSARLEGPRSHHAWSISTAAQLIARSRQAGPGLGIWCAGWVS